MATLKNLPDTMRPFGMSEEDTEALGRLIGKYGRETIAAALEVPAAAPPEAGRPSRRQPLGLYGLFASEPIPRDEAADAQQSKVRAWLKEQEAQHRRARHRSPTKKAQTDLYRLIYGGDQTVREMGAFCASLKRHGRLTQRDLQYLRARNLKEFEGEI